jgi:hypothetical protein
MNRPFDISSIEELLRSIHLSDVIYMGDFHTFDQSSRNLRRLLEKIIIKLENLSLGIELVEYINQKYINNYLNNQITELEFLELIDYHESWRFPWTHYKIIFDFAKEHKLNIYALNSKGDLNKRDEFAANLVSTIIQKSNTKMLIFFGELHILPNKIPKKLNLRLKHFKDIKQTIIHQNIDEVYFKIEGNESQSKVVKFNESEFSLQTAPPWIKYESMTYWYENLCDDPEFDIHEFIIEKGTKLLGSNSNDYFIMICKEILNSTNIKSITNDQIEDFNLYDLDNIEYIINKYKKDIHKYKINYINHLITSNQTFKLPVQKDYYCPNYSITRIAYLSGMHLSSILFELDKININDIFIKNNKRMKFLLILNNSFVGYFTSKIINPFRKCDLYIDLQNRLSTASKIERKTIKATLDIIDSKNFNDIDQIFYRKKLNFIHDSTRSAGHFLAEILFNRLKNHNHEVTTRFIKKQLFSNRLNTKNFIEFKNFLLTPKVNNFKYKETQKRFF